MNETPMTYVGYSMDEEIRFKSSSGGVTTAIIKYLFDTGKIGTALSCFFNKETCQYEPQLIYSFKEYNLTGSVYQDMDIVRFINANIDNIKGAILVVCAPCQVSPIRNLLSKKGIKSFIIDYFCSGQVTLDGTYFYYKALGIDKDNVDLIRYRGNGWPNGIEITLKSGEVIKKPNYVEPWVTLHRSKLFAPKRCLYCKLAESTKADISVGDPWLDEFKDEKIGQTLFLVHSDAGENIIKSMVAKGDLSVRPVEYSYFEKSQKPNLEKSLYIEKNKNIIDFIIEKQSDQSYFNWATSNLDNLRVHNKKILNLYRKNIRKQRTLMQNIMALITKLTNKIK